MGSSSIHLIRTYSNCLKNPGDGGTWWSVVYGGAQNQTRLKQLNRSSSSMHGCESWTIKKAGCQRIGAFQLWCWRRLLRVPWTTGGYISLQEMSWLFIGRTDAEAETPIFWPSDAKNWLIWKDPDSGKGWRREEKGNSEDEMVGWRHWLNGHEYEVNSRS